MPTRRFVLAAALAVAGLALARPALAEPLKRVPAKHVCMVNNTLFDKDQIPVAVDGKTYFGCCEMCKKTLAEKAGARVSTDPVSGKEVDKAKAIIGAKADGTTI